MEISKLMKYTVKEDIKNYYDEATSLKLKDYVYGNAREDKAWQTIKRYVQQPKNILEIGCGIGIMSHRCHQYWPDAEIIGIDISERSVSIANALFKTDHCSFYTSLPTHLDGQNRFDVIMLIDVLEHVEIEQRPELLNLIKNNLSEQGMLLLAFPTPNMLNINRTHFPERLQPVEVDIHIADLLEISNTIGLPLIFYKEVFVSEKRDYAHSIFADILAENIEKKQALREQVVAKLKSYFQNDKRNDTQFERKLRVLEKLNIDVQNP